KCRASAGPMDDKRVGRSPRARHRRTQARQDRVHPQKHRSREPDCPRRSSLPGIPEIACSVPDQCPQRSVSSDPPQIAQESYRENKIRRRVFTQPGSFATEPARPARQLMSAFLQKRPNCCAHAKWREGPKAVIRKTLGGACWLSQVLFV